MAEFAQTIRQLENDLSEVRNRISQRQQEIKRLESLSSNLFSVLERQPDWLTQDMNDDHLRRHDEAMDQAIRLEESQLRDERLEGEISVRLTILQGIVMTLCRNNASAA